MFGRRTSNVDEATRVGSGQPRKGRNVDENTKKTPQLTESEREIAVAKLLEKDGEPIWERFASYDRLKPEENVLVLGAVSSSESAWTRADVADTL